MADKKFKLHILFNEDGDPVTFFQEICGTVRAVTGDVFDTLVGAPACAGVSLMETEA